MAAMSLSSHSLGKDCNPRIQAIIHYALVYTMWINVWNSGSNNNMAGQ
jgi:hypothetical protein